MILTFHCTGVNSTESVTQATFNVVSDNGTVTGTLTHSANVLNDATFEAGKDYDDNFQVITIQAG